MTYSRTDNKGNITVHAAPAKGGAPLCGAGFGVDGYWRESGYPVQCRRCSALLAKRSAATGSIDHAKRLDGSKPGA